MSLFVENRILAKLAQEISFHAFDGTHEGLLRALRPDPINEILRAKDPYRQLRYVVDYLQVPQLGAKSFLCEGHYIDRDYMEDHGVFYARSLAGYPNHCKRLHFFALSEEELIRRGRALGETADAAAAQASLNAAYLGFVVVKPLPGAPIGRTVLRHLPRDKGDGHLRSFRCVRDYDVHVLGLKLTVSGLAFQQQDEGVSACATTAIWSALQKVRDFEDIRIATPAEITSLASRHTLPFGRAMPQEQGLSIDQMCQAIQAIGLAPNLYRSETPDDILSYIYSAERSCFPSILIVRIGSQCHAVTVVGVKTLPGSVPAVDGLHDLAREMRAIYVHDDRTGPYLRADIERNGGFSFKVPYPKPVDAETWQASHLIVPVHAKIRLSLASLRRICKRFAVAVRKAAGGTEVTIRYENFVAKGYEYVERLCQEGADPGLQRLGLRLAERCPLPRYVGVMHVEVGDNGWIHLLLDTTSTTRSVECSAIAYHENAKGTLTDAARKLGRVYLCDAFGSRNQVITLPEELRAAADGQRSGQP